ncbi:hypothetical protein, unlikely [Trypanosoma brucei gambiense DAL972]|uniref:Uncharacterized protein n=1 Tax=Trypanosoma brucei gambiense (strain MHOM/CI/86/DAL972) TaxID=679716 RepID=C9ZPA2_TRYB9|nr:hypothetical protein, unlikely [Trypanosoma brucei gambiense DAL972]CBH11230.1 hypothetical protein, unlikely [Trypanosoma brucei gambiense DAL972]|eukprot:XP_011773517.1 hypothetical protein, unlikely [Trypanosoma brucei gambiense DAL972]
MEKGEATELNEKKNKCSFNSLMAVVQLVTQMWRCCCALRLQLLCYLFSNTVVVFSTNLVIIYLYVCIRLCFYKLERRIMRVPLRKRERKKEKDKCEGKFKKKNIYI